MSAPAGTAASAATQRSAFPFSASPRQASTLRSQAPDRPTRIDALDLFRGIATIIMVIAHATNALLAAEFRQGWAWQQINILFGFVAPAFLLVSGAALRLALERKAAGAEVPPGALGSHLRRATTILLIGYWLQIPVLSLRQLIYCHRPLELARLFDANILQIIGITQILTLLAIPALRTRRARTIFGVAAAVLIGVATPYAWSGAWYHALPLPLASYLAPQPHATFPLLPFGAHFFLGFAGGGALASLSGDRGSWLRAIGIGAAAIAAGLGLDRILSHVPPHNDFWGSSGQHLLFRAGGALLGFGAIASVDRKIPAWIRGGIITIGRSSLAIYVLHLMVIYGSPLNIGLRALILRYLPLGLSPWEICTIAILTCVICVIAVRLWEQLRADQPKAALWMKRGWWTLFWVLFLAIP